jgi:CRP/FNR family transcriptional regulator, cyclic AMP receptor protein
MNLTPKELASIPLLRGITEDQLVKLASAFEYLALPEGEVLFEEGQVATAFYLLAGGEVSIYEGDALRYRLHPPAPIGELGALAGLTRNTTAVASQHVEIWKISRDQLLQFFDTHGDIALPFYQNLLHLIADKVRRDQLRLEDMRANIIRTQKAMKQMRDFILESQDTPLSDTLHGKLEELIQNNRRVNYRIEPPAPLPARAKLKDGSTATVVQISRTHLSFHQDSGPLPEAGGIWIGVLYLDGPEIPISGTVLRTIGHRVDLKLDLLIEEYGLILDGYLTRVQMLDFMV